MTQSNFNSVKLTTVLSITTRNKRIRQPQICQHHSSFNATATALLLHFALVTLLLLVTNHAFHCVYGYYDSTCNEPLLSDARLSASSELSPERNAEAAVLDSQSAWTAVQSDFAQYIIVDLGKKFNITAILTQGRAYGAEYVKEYRVDYGYDGKDFAPYRDRNGNIKTFDANDNDRNTVENLIDPPLVAQFLRINPTRWHNRISMRLQVHGCGYNAEVLGLDGQSMILFDLRRNHIDAYENHIRFRFRTSQSEANILYASDEVGDMMAVQLINNKLLYSVNLGAGQTQSVSAGSLLDDNTWHDVSIDRYGKDVVMSVDRIVVKKKLEGDFFRLNINQELWIGGVPSLMYNSVGTRANFSGCIENLLLNSTNIGAEFKEDTYGYLYQSYGYIYHFCMHQPTQSITFMTNESYFSVEGYQLQVLNCSLEFRTFVDNGILLYSKFSVGESITLNLKDGKLVASIQGEQSPMVHIEPSDTALNDGSWHSVRALVKENSINLIIDGETSQTKRKFRFQSGREYFIGGSPDPRPGFIGCMRFVYIEGRYVSFSSIPIDRMHKTEPKDVVLDACHMIDKCQPNPCEHNGLCKQDHVGFTCDCSNTGYLGAVCHVSEHPPSCESFKIEYPREKEKKIYIDVDGSGPLKPVMVTCKFIPKGPTQTIMHHKSEEELVVQGFDGRGSFVKKIDYNAPYDSIRTIVTRSSSCSQFIKYSCTNARLMNSGMVKDSFDPFSWWVGYNNQKMDYWGGSLPGSGMCACGLDGSCKDPLKGCNCDSLQFVGNQEASDEGLITQSDYLPVRELRIGDTGNFITPSKQAKVYLGPLICEGDAIFNEAITFKYDDASIVLPNVVLGEASDIYLQFKTTVSSAILLHGRGLNDTIKLSIINQKSVQFVFSNGKDMQPLTVEASYRLNDNNWHSIMIERNKKEARLVIDGQISSNVRARMFSVLTVPVMSQLSIGATEDFKEGFVGCIRSLLINGQIIDLTKAVNETSYGLLLGCQGRCESNPCMNKGVCKEGYSSFTCDCQWTAYKGPICTDEVGVNLRSDNYIRYDFDTALSTVEETIRVGFTTSEHKGLIVGITSQIGEYINLLMSTSGHLKLEFDFGFERKEEVIKQENFALGQHHDLTIRRIADGSKLLVTVDNYEPQVFVYKLSKDADAKFDQLKSIYIGRNETMDGGEGFVGCISHVSFDDNFPLRFLFQETKKPNVHAFPPDDSIREDTCGIEPIRPPPEKREKRPLATLRDSFSKRAPIITSRNLRISTGIIALIALLALSVFYIYYRSHEKGDYVTKEDIGAKEALDPDTAVVMGVTGPMIAKKQEYYI